MREKTLSDGFSFISTFKNEYTLASTIPYCPVCLKDFKDFEERDQEFSCDCGNFIQMRKVTLPVYVIEGIHKVPIR